MLEKAFNAQFERGVIDRDALSGAIHDVVQAMPQAARPNVQAHIDQILQRAEKLVSEMTPAERAEATVSPAPEAVDRTRQALINAWGWPGAAGWGGIGAFGFPAAYGFSTGFSCQYRSEMVNGLGYSAGGCVPY
jgi:hypothetical protein